MGDPVQDSEFRRLVDAVRLLARLQKSPLFNLLPDKAREFTAKVLRSLTPDALKALRSDPSGVNKRLLAVAPSAARYKQAFTAVATRLTKAGWTLTTSGQASILRRASRESLLTIYNDGLGPDAVSITPSGGLNIIGAPTPEPAPAPTAWTLPEPEGGYLVAKTGSPSERAMVAAENALRVPMVAAPATAGMGSDVQMDPARFKVLEFTKAAAEALDDVPMTPGHGQVTHDLVRGKIGKAQVRAGWQDAPSAPAVAANKADALKALANSVALFKGAGHSHIVRGASRFIANLESDYYNDDEFHAEVESEVMEPLEDEDAADLGVGFKENARVVWAATQAELRLDDAPHTKTALAEANAALLDVLCAEEEKVAATVLLRAAEAALNAALFAGTFIPGEDYDDETATTVADELTGAPDNLRLQVLNAINAAEACGAGQTGLFTARVQAEAARIQTQYPSDLPERISDVAGVLTGLSEQINLSAKQHLEALAHNANINGAPTVAQGILKLVAPPKFKDHWTASVMDPQFKDAQRLSAALVNAAAGTGLGASEQRKLAAGFIAALPVTTLKTAFGAWKSVKQIAADTGATLPGTVKPHLTAAAASYRARNGVAARKHVREAVGLLAEQLRTSVRGTGLSEPYLVLATDLTSPDVVSLPDDVISLPPSAPEINAEAERIDAEDPPPPPPEPVVAGPVPPPPDPIVAATAPTLAELKTYIAAASGDPAVAEQSIRAAFSGWWNSAEFLAAVQSFVRDTVSAPNTHFTIYRTQAPASADLVGDSFFASTYDLTGAPDANQPPDASQWRRVAVPVDREQEQVTAYTRAGGGSKTEDQFLMEHAGAAGRPPDPLADEGTPPSVTPAEGSYYIEDDGAGGYAAWIDSGAYDALLFAEGGSLIFSSDGTGQDSVTNDFGTVYLEEYPDRYRVTAAQVGFGDEEVGSVTLPAPVTGFLAELERQRIADCATRVCVSTILGTEGDEGGVTVELIEQGMIANLANWTDNLGVALQTDFDATDVVLTDTDASTRWLERGVAAGEASVQGAVNPADPSTVAFSFRYHSAVTGVTVDLRGVMPLGPFILGDDVAEAVMDKAESEGVFAVALVSDEEIEEVAAVVELSEDWFTDMVGQLTKITKDQLQETATKGSLISASKSEVQAAQPKPKKPSNEVRT
jgi:hypothetical protein